MKHFLCVECLFFEVFKKKKRSDDLYVKEVGCLGDAKHDSLSLLWRLGSSLFHKRKELTYIEVIYCLFMISIHKVIFCVFLMVGVQRMQFELLFRDPLGNDRTECGSMLIKLR